MRGWPGRPAASLLGLSQGESSAPRVFSRSRRQRVTPQLQGCCAAGWPREALWDRRWLGSSASVLRAPIFMGGHPKYTHFVAFSSQNLSWAGQCFCTCFTGEDPWHREVKVLVLSGTRGEQEGREGFTVKQESKEVCLCSSLHPSVLVPAQPTPHVIRLRSLVHHHTPNFPHSPVSCNVNAQEDKTQNRGHEGKREDRVIPR